MRYLRTFGTNLNFIWNKNLVRLLIVLAVMTALIAANGTVQFLQNVIGMIGAIPAFALQLSFAASYIIFQFGILFFLPLIAWAVVIVFSVIAGMKANEGQLYTYPMTLRLVK